MLVGVAAVVWNSPAPQTVRSTQDGVVVAVHAPTAYDDALHVAHGAHARSLVGVAGRISYWTLGVQLRRGRHRRFDVGDDATDWYCVPVQTVVGKQARADVAVHGAASYCEELQVPHD